MDFSVARRKMVREQLVERGIQDRRILELMGSLPRHEFVETGMQSQAYEDRPISIGFGQTISQPYIVGLMTEQLGLTGTEKVLEIGTGSGYQTALLSQLAKHIYSIERISSLSNRSRRLFYRNGYLNVTLRIGDGSVGWPEEAPFDIILAAAGAPEVPRPYIEQLKEGGRLIMPRGSEMEQVLVLVTRQGNRLQERVLGDCRFVKLYGQHGWAAHD